MQNRPMSTLNPKTVLLLTAPPWSTAYPPLALAYLAQAVRSSGHSAIVRDLNIMLHDAVSQDRKVLWEMEHYRRWHPDYKDAALPLIKAECTALLTSIFTERSADLIGISAHSGNISSTQYILRWLEEHCPGIPVVLGGTGTTSSADRIYYANFKNLAGYVVGDGELPLVSLLDLPQADWPSINGFVAQNAWERPVTKAEKSKLQTLGDLGFPTFEEFDLPRYSSGALPILLSRGCRLRCAFCNEFEHIPKYLVRTPRIVADEVAFHQRLHPPKYYHFNDLLLNGDLAALEEFCDEIIARDLRGLSFTGQMNVNTAMNVGYFEKMRRAGFVSVNFGLENMNNNVLRRMKKGYTAEEATLVLERAHAAGLRIYANYIVGFPGETEEDFRDSLANMERIAPLIHEVKNLNACSATWGSPMAQRPEVFKIAIPPENGSEHWYALDGSLDIAVRERRLHEARTYFVEKGITKDFFYVSPFKKRYPPIEAMLRFNETPTHPQTLLSAVYAKPGQPFEIRLPSSDPSRYALVTCCHVDGLLFRNYFPVDIARHIIRIPACIALPFSGSKLSLEVHTGAPDSQSNLVIHHSYWMALCVLTESNAPPQSWLFHEYTISHEVLSALQIPEARSVKKSERSPAPTILALDAAKHPSGFGGRTTLTITVDGGNAITPLDLQLRLTSRREPRLPLFHLSSSHALSLSPGNIAKYYVDIKHLRLNAGAYRWEAVFVDRTTGEPASAALTKDISIKPRNMLSCRKSPGYLASR